MTTETEMEQRAKTDMGAFLAEDPAPSDIESDEYYAWNRRRIARARSVMEGLAGATEFEQMGHAIPLDSEKL